MEQIQKTNNGLKTKTEQEAFNQLPDSLKEFTLVRLEKCVKDIIDFDLKDACLDIIGIAYVEQAQMDVHPNMRVLQADTLFNELRRIKDFKLLTVSEVRLAFKMGVRREFDTDKDRGYGMCAATYNFWLKSYCKLPQRFEGYNQYRNLIDTPVKIELSEKEKREILFDGIIKAFEEYKEKKEAFPKLSATLSTIFFNILEETKLIVLTKEEIAEIKATGKIHLKRLLNSEKSFIEGYLGEYDFNTACNIVAIKIYFDKWIKNKFDLKTEINKLL